MHTHIHMTNYIFQREKKTPVQRLQIEKNWSLSCTIEITTKVKLCAFN